MNDFTFEILGGFASNPVKIIVIQSDICHVYICVYCAYVWVFFGGEGGGGNKRKPVCHSEKDIRFQTNMAARVVHASIFQTFIFHTRNENTSFKTSKRKEKVLTNVFLTWEWRLESWKRWNFPLRIGIHLSRSDDISFFRIHTWSWRIF